LNVKPSGGSTRRSRFRAGQTTIGTVPDTSQKKGFDIWIAQHVGLNYETFTSSVLLLQGKAERLLNCTPKERAECWRPLSNSNATNGWPRSGRKTQGA